ncbi:MAG: L-threonylcarbamoyladenylate synthase [Firmicutes bacterium]|nr:L-threonylcarbamoyladenylate synthase [Bacillota bacterium]
MYNKIGGTLIFDVKAAPAAPLMLAEAARILVGGGLVAFPTETVYGLGANALDAQAVQKIYLAKGRPSDNPLIVHIAEFAQLQELACEIPPAAEKLARHFWPGPLTLVLKKRAAVPDVVTGGLDSVAVRIPAHPVALALLRATGRPVAAPSANLAGRPSPTSAQHVIDDLAGRIDAVLDGGPCAVGVESTILDIRGGCPLLLRPGGVTPEQISFLLGKKCLSVAWQEDTAMPPPSPGLKYTHYAPQVPLYLVLAPPEKLLAEIACLQDKYRKQGKHVGLLLSKELAAELEADTVEILGSRDHAAELAANLYGALRRLDKSAAELIIAEGYSEAGLGLAVMNRLKKAAGPRVLVVE